MSRGDDLKSVGELFPSLLDPIDLQKPGRVKRGDRPPADLPQRVLDVMAGESIKPTDVAYTHSIFLQCFMPLRHKKANELRWQANNGNASLVMRAGELMNPSNPNEFKVCQVPAGPKARVLIAYINDFAYRKQTPVIPLGTNLHKAMKQIGVKVSGQNGEELKRELENIAAAEIILGVWGDGKAEQQQTKIAKRMSFWLERDPNQQQLWQQELVLSPDYYASLQGDHMAPLWLEAILGLQHNARAQDIFALLQYRLRKPLLSPVMIHKSELHKLFGQDIKLERHFWAEFKLSLDEALRWYPKARVEVKNDCMVLRSSPPVVPFRKLGRPIREVVEK